ncbi:hypothetical protein ASPTUDRAFT_39349 [Aspergillus tubingensis CBS 134.48]|uniref:Secreted protein n=1 Tax=Aspergillus tubingensis (strain CBS 134.48) TaxID=767770 RepID=A0A1L9NB23_ASPTC|nr:hypothetical protein ASPTUDRAFT_39349 [Aspergillus tubingensis CBS 134.48]
MKSLSAWLLVGLSPVAKVLYTTTDERDGLAFLVPYGGGRGHRVDHGYLNSRFSPFPLSVPSSSSFPLVSPPCSVVRTYPCSFSERGFVVYLITPQAATYSI